MSLSNWGETCTHTGSTGAAIHMLEVEKGGQDMVGKAAEAAASFALLTQVKRH